MLQGVQCLRLLGDNEAASAPLWSKGEAGSISQRVPKSAECVGHVTVAAINGTLAWGRQERASAQHQCTAGGVHVRACLCLRVFM